ncbi:MAG TPA: RES family NAD+ phosphorylase [Burkholderiales bacterium]|nr:RES family NAD+ phosphorylase [Burkholderiales bacterium]
MVAEISRVAWKPCYRLVPSRFPPVGIYDRVADPADLEAVFAVENLTNPRLRQETGDISLVPPEDRITGPGTTPIMAAFTHLDPEGNRFSDGNYGIYYAAKSLDTAIEETRYSRARFLSRTNEEPIEVDMRTYQTDVKGELHDIRGRTDLADVYDPDNYAAGQAFGRALKAINSNGIVYDSVRHKRGSCIGVFRPRILSNCIQGPHFCYVWDGTQIKTIYEKKIYAAR